MSALACMIDLALINMDITPKFTRAVTTFRRLELEDVKTSLGDQAHRTPKIPGINLGPDLALATRSLLTPTRG
jgi:hypothetical protein